MLKEKLKLLPDKPGCYMMKDKDNIIIYIGKAKNLKKRVLSYFNRSHNKKTGILVNNIFDFEYIITDSELEALLLEINLIKKYEPKYNILLKDDKTYPYIELTNESIPRLIVTRIKNTKKSKGKLFGPYPNAFAARKTVEIINRIYPLRKCINMPKKVCLYYHIDECLGFCEHKIDDKLLLDMIDQITKFLNGNSTFITKKIKEEMDKASLNLNYEKAQEMKEYLEYIDVVLTEQHIDLKDNIDRDIIGYFTIDNYLSIKILSIRNGKLIETRSNIFETIEDEVEELTYYITVYYENNFKPKELLLSNNFDMELIQNSTEIKTISPLKGKKKLLLDMANYNAKVSLEQEIELIKRKNDSIDEAIEQLKTITKLDNVNRIEIFDNSHLFGTYSVSGMVVFTLGKPDKKEYRKYKIESDAKDDYNLMKEVIYRRYYKVLIENLEKPNLIVVDGGKQQINAAQETLKSLHLNIPVIGFIKNNRHKTEKIMYNNYEIEIIKDSSLFHFIERMQNEVHKFTVNYHKNIRSKGLISSYLDEIPGIGEVSKKEILSKYSDLSKLKELTLEQLKKELKDKTATNLYNYFNKEKERA